MSSLRAALQPTGSGIRAGSLHSSKHVMRPLLASSRHPALQQPMQQTNKHGIDGCSTSYSSPVAARSSDPRGSGSSSAGPQFNGAYVAIFTIYGVLFALKNPYIFAALSILTIIPQNSAITSLNSLVALFYETGLFMNFAEAVYCVRLMTWLSIGCTLLSFAFFA